MALVLADRVKDTTTTTGTGAVTLSNVAPTGFRTFGAAIGGGNSTYYTIAGQGSSEWEVGIGTYTAAGTSLSRDTVLASSNANAPVNFSAGTKDVFVTYPAGKAIADGYGTLPVANGGTGQTSYTNGQLLIGNSTGNTLAKATLTAGTGISVSNGAGSITIINSAPDQTVALTGAGTTSVTGTYPNFTITSNDQYVGTVTSVSGTGTVNGLTLTGTVTSSGSLTLGGTLSVDLSTATVTGTLPVSKGGTGVTTSTGSGSAVLSTSPSLSQAVLNDGYTEEVFAITDGATVNLDPNNGSIQTWTLGASRTPGQANWAAGQSITLMVDDGTAYSITWTTLGVVWETNAGSAPTLATSGYTVITLWKVGTTIYGARVGDA